MRIKSRRVLLLTIATIAIVAAVCLPIGPYEERRTYRCDVCFAKRDVFRWWVGSWGAAAMPVSAEREFVSESKFGENFLPEHKEHEWDFAQGSPYYWGARWGGCALGSGRHVSDAFTLYEKYPEFRTLVEEKIKAGVFTRQQVIAVFSNRSRDPGWLQEQAKELIDEFFRRASKE